MDIWISAEIESDVAEDFRLANNALEDELSAFLKPKKYDLELDSLDCIAIIRNDTYFEEIHRYSPKKRDMDFRLTIDYSEFKSSSLEQRKFLILRMLIRAVSILATKRTITKDGALQLQNDIESFSETRFKQQHNQALKRTE